MNHGHLRLLLLLPLLLQILYLVTGWRHKEGGIRLRPNDIDELNGFVFSHGRVVVSL
jgi:hypothetical protein